MFNLYPQPYFWSKTIVLLVDWRLDKHEFWLKTELEKLGYNIYLIGIPNYNMLNRVVKWRKFILWWHYVVQGWQGALRGKKYNSIIISWNFIPGVFCSIFSKIIMRNRHPVISLNMIAHNKGIINNLIRDFIYKFSFTKTDIFITVNSEEYRKFVISKYRINPNNIFVLNDPVDIIPPIIYKDTEDEGYVFSGGEAARDWDTLMRAAFLCPEIPFVIIARKKYWKFGENIPPNIKVYFDTSAEVFYSMALKSRLVVLPLNSFATAGLIVLKNCVLLNRLVISSETPATKLYYPLTCRDLLVPIGDSKRMAEKIKEYYGSPSKRERKIKLQKDHIINNFSQKVYTNRLNYLINTIKIKFSK